MQSSTCQSVLYPPHDPRGEPPTGQGQFPHIGWDSRVYLHPGLSDFFLLFQWLHITTQLKFVAMMTTQLDIDLALKSFSTAAQSDSRLVINYPDGRSAFKT